MNRQDFIELAESLGWGTYECEDGSVEISKHSSYGQDFSQTLWFDDSAENVSEDINHEVYACWDNFDPSSEAYIWLDNDGHGMNGAPHDMQDVYDDMLECKEMLRELAEAVRDSVLAEKRACVI